MDPIEEYLNQVRARLSAEPMQKEAILSELRSHLWEKVRDLEERRPDADPAAIQQAVIQDFGAPQAVAAAYTADTLPDIRPAGAPKTLVVQIDGRIVDAASRVKANAKDAARAMKRGAGRAAVWTKRKAPAVARLFGALWHLTVSILVFAWTLLARLVAWVGRTLGVAVKWSAILVLVLVTTALAAATFVGIFLFDDVAETVAAQQSTRALDIRDDCWSAPCTRSVDAARFHVGDPARSVDLQLFVQPHPETNGTLAVQVTDPSGYGVLVRSFDATPSGISDETQSWAPTPGTWTVDYDMDGFRGVLYVRAHVRGM